MVLYYTCQSLAATLLALCQFTCALTVSNQWDMTNIIKVDDMRYVLDSVTEDRMLSLGFYAPDMIFDATNPRHSTLGMQYYGQDSKDILQMQSWSNLNAGMIWSLDFWVYLSVNQNTQYMTIFSIQQRFSDEQYIHLQYDSVNKNFRLITEFPYFSGYYWNSELTEGWNFISFTLDYVFGSPNANYMHLMVRNSDLTQPIYNNYLTSGTLIYIYDPDTAVLNIGGYQTNNDIAFSWEGYIKRVRFINNYMYNSIDFKAQTKQTQVCIGDPPCSICLQSTLTCEGVTDPLGKIFDLDLDQDTSQFVVDSTANKRGVQKLRSSTVELNEPHTIFGQGLLFLFDSAFNIGRAEFNRNLMLSTSFSFDCLLKASEFTNFFQRTRFFGAQHVDTNDQVLEFSFQWSQMRIRFRNQSNNLNQFDRNIGLNTFYPGSGEEWHYISIVFQAQQTNTVIRTNVFPRGSNGRDESTRFNNYLKTDYPQDKVVPYLGDSNSIIIKRARMFNFPISQLDIELAVKQGVNCAPLGTQPQCPVCPYNTGTCLPVCQMNEFGDDCTPCHPFCQHCTGPNIDDCIYCTWDESLEVITSGPFGNCTCQHGFYYDDTTQTCEPCNARCDGCFGPSNLECFDCNYAAGNNFYPDSFCLGNCDKSGYLGVISSRGHYNQVEADMTSTCVVCHPFCASCYGPNENQCFQCEPGYVQFGSTCQDGCPEGLWLNTTDMTCRTCHGECSDCVGPGNWQCTECAIPTKVQQNGRCQNTCDYGFYPNPINKCVTCHGFCQACSGEGNIDVCSACNSGYFKEYQGFSCLDSCVPGTFADAAANECFKCHYTCETCDGPNADNCLVCQNSFYEENGLCKVSCSQNKFVVGNSCMSCDSACITCFGVNQDECYSCNDGYFFFNFTCVEECPDGFYGDIGDNTCYACPDECETCTSYDFCTECIYGPYQLNDGECTFFTCLDSQFRSIRPFLACYDCHRDCHTCQGSTNVDCLSCSSEKIFKEMQCLTCDDQPGLMTPLQDGWTECEEVCGDGFNYGVNPCDDGNNADGDGCDRYCQIELGYICQGGSQSNGDYCTRIKKPTASLELVSSSNTIYVLFDEEVQLQDLNLENGLQISVFGPEEPYDFDWNLLSELNNLEFTQKCVIEMTLYSSLKGNKEERVELLFTDKSIYQSTTGNELLTTQLQGYLNEFEYIDPMDLVRIEAAGKASMMASFGAMALNMGVSLLFGGSISSMWVMLNTIQLLSLLPLMAVPWPLYAIRFFKLMLSSHGDASFLPNFFAQIALDLPEVTKDKLNKRFEIYGFDNSNFILLSGQKITLFVLILAIYPIIHYMDKKFADKHVCCKGWNFLKTKYVFTIPLRFYLISFAYVYLSAFLNMWMMSFRNKSDSISFFSSVTCLVAMTYSPVFLMNTLQQNYREIGRPKFQQRWSTILAELDHTKPTRYAYYPVFLIRRTAFVILLVFFSESPYAQVVILSLLCVIMIAYLAIIRPQTDRIVLILNIFSEMVMLFMHMFSIIFLSQDMNEDKQNDYGFVVCILVALYILSNWILILTLLVIQNIKKFINWFKTRDKRKKVKIDNIQAKKLALIQQREYQKKKGIEKQRKMTEQLEAYEKYLEEETGPLPGQGSGFILDVTQDQNNINVLELQKNQYKPKDHEIISEEDSDQDQEEENSSRPMMPCDEYPVSYNKFRKTPSSHNSDFGYKSSNPYVCTANNVEDILVSDDNLVSNDSQDLLNRNNAPVDKEAIAVHDMLDKLISQKIALSVLYEDDRELDFDSGKSGINFEDKKKDL